MPFTYSTTTKKTLNWKNVRKQKLWVFEIFIRMKLDLCSDFDPGIRPRL